MCTAVLDGLGVQLKAGSSSWLGWRYLLSGQTQIFGVTAKCEYLWIIYAVCSLGGVFVWGMCVGVMKNPRPSVFGGAETPLWAGSGGKCLRERKGSAYDALGMSLELGEDVVPGKGRMRPGV